MSYSDAYAQALRLLAMREHSQVELVRKLSRHPVQEVMQVLTDLVEQGLQSDQRFTEIYVHSRQLSGFGPMRIGAELREKGIAEALSKSVLDQEEEVWRTLMLQVAEKKYGSTAAGNDKDRAKRARFLAQRGFPMSMILGYLRSIQ